MSAKHLQFKPLQDRILVRRMEEEETTRGGLIIPDTAKEKPMRGQVVAVGPGAVNDQGQLMAMDVKVDDVVLFGKWSGTEIKMQGDEYLVIKASDVLGIFV